MNTGLVKWAALIAIVAKALSMIVTHLVRKLGFAAIESGFGSILIKAANWISLFRDLSLLFFLIAFLVFISGFEKERKSHA